MIIALIGQKGGSGKSTTAINLVAEWCRRDRKVLLVDADPQGSSRTWGELAARSSRGRAPTVIAMGAEMHRPGQLPAVASAYDLTVIDTPPRNGDTQRAALMVADLAIFPCGPTAMDIWALAESLDLARRARVLRPQLDVAVLITRKISRSSLGAAAREALADCGFFVLKTELGFRVAYQEAPALGLGVSTYGPSRSAAALEIRALADEVQMRGIQNRTPIPEVNHVAA